jgi:hypothetical protein
VDSPTLCEKPRAHRQITGHEGRRPKNARAGPVRNVLARQYGFVGELTVESRGESVWPDEEPEHFSRGRDVDSYERYNRSAIWSDFPLQRNWKRLRE